MSNDASDATAEATADGSISAVCMAEATARTRCGLSNTDCTRERCEQQTSALWSETLITATIECIQSETECSLTASDGGFPELLLCAARKLAASTPSAAVLTFAQHYCANCPADADAGATCERSFLAQSDGGDQGQWLISLQLRGLNDAVVREMDTACTTPSVLGGGSSCYIKFSQCAERIRNAHTPPACPDR